MLTKVNLRKLNISEHIRQLKIIFYALAAGQIVIFLAFFLMRWSGFLMPGQNQSGLFRFLIPLLILVSILLSKFLYNKRVQLFDKTLDLQKKILSYKINNLIKWSLMKAANVLTAIAYLYTDYYLYVILFLIFTMLFFINGPSEEKFAYEYELN